MRYVKEKGLEKAEKIKDIIFESSTGADRFITKQLNESFHKRRESYREGIRKYFDILYRIDNGNYGRQHESTLKGELITQGQENRKLEKLISQK